MIGIYVDGGVVSSNPSPYGGVYAYKIINVDGSVLSEGCEISTSPLPFTNNMSEYIAALYGMVNMPSGLPAVLFSDSQITLGRIFKSWKTEGIPESWKSRMDTEYNRLRRFLLYELLDGHPTKSQLMAGTGKRGHRCSIYNVEVDKMCQMKSKQYLENINQKRT